MTAKEAIANYSDACAAVVISGSVLINGNREPISVALSKHIEAAVDLTDLSSPRSDWKGVVKVTPKGETEASFYLCVE